MCKIKFALVGRDYIGKRHASMISGNSDFELVAFCDVNPKVELELENFASRL